MAISIKPTPASVRREISGMHAAPTVSLQILAPLASGNRVLMPALALLAGLLLAAVGRPIHATEAEPLDPINVPTDAPPSPLFGAQPFTQKMLLFEEFGLQPMPTVAASPDTVLPPPRDCLRGPEDGPLDAFLAKSLFPLPTQEAYLGSPNPWETQIKGCIPGVTRTFMEGRPPGEFFAHQRWTEFFPQVFFQSAMAGARDNGGLRDPYQRHGYVTGEFGENGLYFLPNGSTKGIKVKFHPSMPEQNLNSVWTFDGTFPPKLLMARYGESILFRHHDALPISPAANNGFGTHTITTHEHNGHSPAESDGYTHAFFFPGQYYDYHWPMILAGHDRINAGAADPRAAMPNGIGGGSNIPGDWRETMSSHWFHDHMLDFTAQNVYKGNAAMMNYYSAVDRGREPRDQAEANGNPATPGYGCHYANEANVNLCLPSGNGLDWGNRDYDVNLLIADKAWNQAGQLYFNVFNRDGFLGDVMTVNWLYKPYMEVRARRYRFRMLNAAVSRYFKIALVDQEGRRAPFHMVANDGNLMEHAVKFETAELPQIGIAERYDIVVDFRNFKEGDTLYFVNLLEHANGRGPQRELPLADVLSGFYQSDPLGLGVDPAVGKFLEFRVKAYAGNDLSMNPADYEEGGKKMIPLPNFTAAELQNAKHRHFEFGRDATDADAALDKPWTIVTDHALRPDGTRDGHTMDPHRLS
ncbi:MAG TPA: hypothetical protein VI457_13895, partial [Methylococcaceae bacterium]|nr:hypothetical protein [Methylococcaceae bacterium]